MNNNVIPLALIGMLLVTVIVISTVFQEPTQVICLKNKCFEAELALTPEQQTRGLSGRNPLENSKAMLFIFPQEEIHRFWMKDMQFSIDIVWISQNGTVVYIERNAQPCSETCPHIVPPAPAKYVLEVNAGGASEIKNGDQLNLQHQLAFGSLVLNI
ncbi:DUF192 domain-containing protein [Candidatus Micrarchaeota archaeon]|nr:DUF192 domain-containing protein [Candidatus Micrarchaeota archaeon]